MDQISIANALSDLPLGELRYFDRVGSTNDLALTWAEQGAPDLSLILADEQTAGRGRAGRRWSTPPQSALALSLILRPSTLESSLPSLFTGLGALALVQTLTDINLESQIKWPNDVLLNGKKVAGILVETAWKGDILESLVLGVGVNVFQSAVPPREKLRFPATSLEEEFGQRPDRLVLLHSLLASLLSTRERMNTPAFIEAWEQALAYRGQMVQIWSGVDEDLVGQLEGLEMDGSLRLRLETGPIRTIKFGEVHLRPLAGVA